MNLIMALLAEYIGQAKRQREVWEDILRLAAEFRAKCNSALDPNGGLWRVQETTDTLRTCLKQAGYHAIASGCFGVVLPYPGDATKVLKVVLATQDGFDLFAEDVILAQRERKARAFMPKIYWRAELRGVRMYCMEYLPTPCIDERCPAELRDYVWDELVHKYPSSVSDLHSGNYMRRADGTVVLIDPIIHGGKANTLTSLAVKLV